MLHVPFDCGLSLDLSALSSFDFSVLIGWAPWILILGGVVAASKLLSMFIKGFVGKILKGVGSLGFFAGLFLLVAGVIVLLAAAGGIDTWGLLILTGLGLALRPLSKIPLGALFGLIAGLACVGLFYSYFPLPAAVLGFSSMWVYLLVFLAPALIVFLVFKFAEDLARLFGLVLGSWPVLTVLGFLCMIQGILLFLNQSLLSLL